MKLSNNLYDTLKWVVMIFMPASISLIATIGQVFESHWTVPVVTILTALNTFLGTILGVSSANYKEKYTNGFSEDSY